MRRAQLASAHAATRLAANSAQNRTSFWFSATSPALQELQTKSSFPSDMWVAQNEVKYRQLEVRPNTLPFAVKLPHQLELFNLDDVTVPDEILNALPPVTEHTSFSTQKPYGQQMRFELENRATMKGYRSKWWITPQAVRTQKFTAAGRGVQSSLILMESIEQIFNGSQLVDPAALNRIPMSGATKKVFAFNGQFNPLFVEDIAKHRYETGVYFSQNHANILGLDVAPAQTPLEAKFENRQERGPFLLYNLSQVENWEALAAEPHPTEHTFLEGGWRVKNEAILSKLLTLEGQFPVKIWLSDRDLKSKNLKLKENQTGVDCSLGMRRMTDGIPMFNLDQLADKAAAKASFGKLVR